MTWRLSWLPFALLLIILPYPGTVAARLLLLLVVFAISTAWFLRQTPESWHPMPGKLALGFWWLVSFASLLYAADPAYSLGELKNELGYTLMALFAFYVIGLKRDPAFFVLRSAVVGVAIMLGWVMLTWAKGGFHPVENGPHGGAGIIATYAVTAIPAAFLLALEDRVAGWRRFGQVMTAGGFLLAALIAQRAVWLAIAAEVLLAGLLLWRTGRISVSRQRLVAAVLAVFIFGVIVVAMITLQRYKSLEAIGRDSRLEFWPQVLATIAAHPWIGAGFGRQSMKIAYPGLVPAYNTELWHAHNLVLNYGLALGLPGIVALLGLFASWGRFFWRHAASPAGIAGCTLIVGVLVRNQFNDFFMRDMSLLFWALVGLFAGICLGREETD